MSGRRCAHNIRTRVAGKLRDITDRVLTTIPGQALRDYYLRVLAHMYRRGGPGQQGREHTLLKRGFLPVDPRLCGGVGLYD